MGRGGETKKDALLTPYNLPVLGEFVIRPALRIGRKARAILLAGRQAFNMIEAVGRRCRPLVGRKITDEIGPAGSGFSRACAVAGWSQATTTSF